MHWCKFAKLVYIAIFFRLNSDLATIYTLPLQLQGTVTELHVLKHGNQGKGFIDHAGNSDEDEENLQQPAKGGSTGKVSWPMMTFILLGKLPYRFFALDL